MTHNCIPSYLNIHIEWLHLTHWPKFHKVRLYSILLTDWIFTKYDFFPSYLLIAYVMQFIVRLLQIARAGIKSNFKIQTVRLSSILLRLNIHTLRLYSILLIEYSYRTTLFHLYSMIEHSYNGLTMMSIHFVYNFTYMTLLHHHSHWMNIHIVYDFTILSSIPLCFISCLKRTTFHFAFRDNYVHFNDIYRVYIYIYKKKHSFTTRTGVSTTPYSVCCRLEVTTHYTDDASDLFDETASLGFRLLSVRFIPAPRFSSNCRFISSSCFYHFWDYRSRW